MQISTKLKGLLKRVGIGKPRKIRQVGLLERNPRPEHLMRIESGKLRSEFETVVVSINPPKFGNDKKTLKELIDTEGLDIFEQAAVFGGSPMGDSFRSILICSIFLRYAYQMKIPLEMVGVTVDYGSAEAWIKFIATHEDEGINNPDIVKLFRYGEGKQRNILYLGEEMISFIKKRAAFFGLELS